MALADRLCLAARLEALAPEFPDRLQQNKSRLTCRTHDRSQQTLINERCQAVENRRGDGGFAPLRRCRWTGEYTIASLPSGPACYRLDRLQDAAASEDGEAVKQRLLWLGQQIVAPGNCVAHRLLAWRHVTSPSREKGQPLL